MRTLNLGIVAHVDAGKTTLTERLLYAAGAIDALGSVDDGTTQTDTLALERRRGITIRAAVVAFTRDDVTVNIIDTPGHPDFIAEVDRSLRVLDGALVVVSAVEGVQAQTVVLMRALQRLHVPTLVFVNKIDRAGADTERTLTAIHERLTRHALPMGYVVDAGQPHAAFVAFDRRDERVDVANVVPVVFGSALTGAGVPALVEALTTLLPTPDGDADAPAAGAVFKIERRVNGEKIAYVRMFTGSLHARERIPIGRSRHETITAIKVFEHGAPVDRPRVVAGQIAALSGLRDARIGDTVGESTARTNGALFARPTLESAIAARDPSRQAALHAALARLAEQDPLINLRQDDTRHQLSLSLYGEVQKEVIAQTIALEYGIDVEFRDTTTICIERPAGVGHAVERLGEASNPYLATIGLEVAPRRRGAGVEFVLDVELITIPLYVYKTVDAFRDAMTQYVAVVLRRGIQGWEVTDCRVTMTDCNYSSPGTTARDMRKLTALVLPGALADAGTVVCEPIHRFRIDAPADTASSVLRLLGRLRGVPRASATSGAWFTVEGEIPAAAVHRLRAQVRGLTRGEGVVEAEFDHYEARR